MHHRINKILFLVLLIYLPAVIAGQDPYYINFDTKDGLPSSEVYAVEADPNGVLWFATDRGVCSYNGYEFKTYTTDDGLANNTTLAIWKDRQGNFWFPGIDGSLSIYDHEKFYPYKWNDSLKATIHRPEKITWDLDGKIFFWRVGESYGKKYSIDEKSGKVSIISSEDLTKKFPILEMENTQFINMEGYYLSIDKDYSSPIVIQTDSTIFYCQKIKETDDLEKVLFKQLIKDKTTTSYKFDSPILTIELEKDGSILVCTKKGLFRFNNGNLKKTPKPYFSELSISDIEIDFEGNYWVTTLQNGIFMVPSFHFETIQTALNNYSYEKILSIAKLKEHILFGSSNGKLFSINNNFVLNEVKEGNLNEQLLYSSSTENHAYFKGLRISEKNGYLQYSIIPTSFAFPGLYELNNKHFFGIGLFEVRILSSQFKIVFSPPEYFFKKRIDCVAEHGDKIWFGTPDGLYSIKDYQYDKIINESRIHNLLQVRINDLKIDNFGNLWISTIGNGIIYKTQDTIFQIDVNDGLISNFVNHLYVENDSSIWVATNKGLNHLTYHLQSNKLKLKKIEGISTIDGLISNYINSVTKWKGRIWLATNKGIVYFSPFDLKKELPRPPIILETVLVNDDTVNFTDTNFKYFQNDLYFKFIGISFRKPTDQPFYRYRLISENTDSTWYYTNNRDIRFNDLPPGEYTFEVAAQNKFGQWSEEPVICPFTINPHFSQTIWFRVIVGLTIITIIAFLIKNRIKQIQFKAEQKRRLQEAELKTKDAELQALRNQMNPHFVFNALNSIQNFIFKNDAKKANYYLSRFSKLMRDGLQFARLKNITLEEEIIFLNTYLELEKMRFPDKFQYAIKVDSQISQRNYFIPPLLFQPILENAIKHAFKNIDYEGFLEIRFEEAVPGELLKVTIVDNGDGYNHDSVNKHTKAGNKSLGLEIIKNQIALLNTEGEDYKAAFKIFNRTSIDPNLKGTQAEFIISIKLSPNDQSSRYR